MKYIIILTAFLVLASCKTSKADCDAYGYVIEKDTVQVTTEHVNYDTNCHESVTLENVIVDTFYFHKN